MPHTLAKQLIKSVPPLGTSPAFCCPDGMTDQPPRRRQEEAKDAAGSTRMPPVLLQHHGTYWTAVNSSWSPQGAPCHDITMCPHVSPEQICCASNCTPLLGCRRKNSIFSFLSPNGGWLLLLLCSTWLVGILSSAAGSAGPELLQSTELFSCSRAVS